jgi:TPP-dependent pyruvate/acetoin dehydrogenase alpha subunit
MSKITIEEAYKAMHLIRNTEMGLLDLFGKGHLRGTVHTSIGQEACAVGVVRNLDNEKDILYSNHRCHGHFLAYCSEVKGLIAEIMGKEEGVCKGVGGSQHLQLRNFYSNGIQGSGMPVIVGMALAEKLKGSGGIGVIFTGDGTFGEGSLYESFNIMALWSAPVLVVIENNRYAQTTPTEVQLSGTFRGRAEAFNINFYEADGMDFEEVSTIAEKCINYVRYDSKPCVLLLNTYRFSPHSKGDDFREVSEIETYKKQDPLLKLKLKIDRAVINEIEQENFKLLEGIISELLQL